MLIRPGRTHLATRGAAAVVEVWDVNEVMSACTFVRCAIIQPPILISVAGDVILIGCETSPPDLFSPGLKWKPRPDWRVSKSGTPKDNMAENQSLCHCRGTISLHYRILTHFRWSAGSSNFFLSIFLASAAKTVAWHCYTPAKC